MTESYDPASRFYFRRKLSRLALLGIGFLTGAVCTFAPVYYLFQTRDVARPQVPGHAVSTANVPNLAAADLARDAVNRFASRMTYELSRPPADKAAGAATPKGRPSSSPTTPTTGAVAVPQRSSTRSPEESPTKIANARPIYATPPDPRDTTREIEKESLRPYREPGRQPPQSPAVPIHPRIIEGRELVIPPKNAPGKTPSERAALASSGSASAAGAALGAAPDRAERVARAKARTGAPSMSGEDAHASVAEVESRLAATRQWLSSAAPYTHTIQILGASNDEQLRAHLKTLSRMLEPSKVYVFRTQAQGKPSVTVLYGAYEDRQAALAALAKLPEAAAANRPVLRTVKGIRAEILQHKAGS